MPTPAHIPSLEVSGLVKTYGPLRAVDSVSFDIQPGEIFALLGRNGAGKTSLLECALGLRAADSGSVRVLGFDLRAQPREVKRRTGAVLQETALQDAITPREAIELFGAFYPRPLPVPALLSRIGLAHKARARFETLSGGERQRLALALAFVNDPALLLLDEPTAGLDPAVRRDLHGAIRQFRAEGRAVLLTTHYIEEAEALCDRVAILHRGRIVATGTPVELIARSGARPRILFRTARPLDSATLARLTGKAQEEPGGGYALEADQAGPAVAELARVLADSGNDLLDLHVRTPSLEDLFLALTHEESAR